MKRPYISPKTMVNVAIVQAGSLMCPLCQRSIFEEHARILEHMVPHELGGASDESNLRWVHKECAAKKTNGSKATSASGDIHKIAKAKRLKAAREAHEMAMAKGILRGEPKPPGSIKSRGFDKTYRKRMNGEVVRRTT